MFIIPKSFPNFQSTGLKPSLEQISFSKKIWQHPFDYIFKTLMQRQQPTRQVNFGI